MKFENLAAASVLKLVLTSYSVTCSRLDTAVFHVAGIFASLLQASLLLTELATFLPILPVLRFTHANLILRVKDLYLFSLNNCCLSEDLSPDESRFFAAQKDSFLLKGILSQQRIRH